MLQILVYIIDVYPRLYGGDGGAKDPRRPRRLSVPCEDGSLFYSLTYFVAYIRSSQLVNKRMRG